MIPRRTFSASPGRTFGAVLNFLILAFLFISLCISASAQSSDTTPPSAPAGLSAAAASCAQVDLSWGASYDETGGSGLKGYKIVRSDGQSITIGATRTTFSDANSVKSPNSYSYQVIALDNAGNSSAASNAATVNTTACPLDGGEQVVDSAYTEPLGKNMATFGARTVFLYQKKNAQQSLDTWIYIQDSDTGQVSRFMLHANPGYNQTETDYLLTSATELWALSNEAGVGGKLTISQYKLNGTPPTSATLVSSKLLGDSNSFGKSLIRLQSGAIVLSWNEEGWAYRSAVDLSNGYAYRSPSGTWSISFPVTVANSGGGNITMSQMALAQHPGDGSVWSFVKRDSFTQISALHFIEATNGLVLDWVNPSFISQTADGDDGPEGEFPFLAVATDTTRNLILVGYQNYRYQSVFTDPLYGDGNMIFLKEAPASVAQVSADGSKSFISFPNAFERASQFGLSAQSDGTIWLAYHPINHDSLTWNEVYASKYQGGAWTTPVLAGYNYNNYNVSGPGRNPGLLIYRTDQPQLAFMTPDQKIHTFSLTESGQAPTTDTIAPTTAISTPVAASTVSGSLTVSAVASDNVGVDHVDLFIDGVLYLTTTLPPFNFLWNTTKYPDGTHVLQTRAVDAAGNAGLSSTINLTVRNQTTSTANLSVAITAPSNGSSVPRSQKVTISAVASDTTAVSKMQFFVNNKLLGTVTAAPYNYPWKVPAKRGTYNIKAQAYDAAGNTASQAINVVAQ